MKTWWPVMPVAMLLMASACGLERSDDEALTRRDALPIDPDPNPPPPPPTKPPPSPRVHEFSVDPPREFSVFLSAGQSIQFETRACSAGTDPVLHLLRETNGVRTEVAFGDDLVSGDLNARVTYTASQSFSGVVLVRAKADKRGTCQLLRNGVLYASSVMAGGKTVSLTGMSVGDEFETVSLPNGGFTQTVYQLAGTGGQQITAHRLSGTGTGLGVRFSLTSTGGTFLVASTGPTRVVVNDVGIADPDGDGLGTALERELGTCPNGTELAFGTFDCSRVKTAKDTDGDGLSDGWEVLGKRDQTPHQLLPRWGANARHKDAFVEIDFAADDQPALKLAPDEARLAGAYWNDTLEAIDPLTQALRAAWLINPDQRPGVALHLDTGVVPTNPAEATLFGDWGGAGVVPAPQSYSTDWVANMVPARRGVFHWALGTRSGSGQTNGFAFTFAMNGAVLAHELGHTMGIAHSGSVATGNVNCKPQYASPMNYAYSYAGVGFSDGIAPAPLNNTRLTEYAALASAPNRARYVDLYERVFKYSVDHTTWSVDYDRDGVIAPQGTTVRAAANTAEGLDCEVVRHRRTVMAGIGVATTDVSPALVRLASAARLLVYRATSVGVQVQLAPDSLVSCTTGGGEDGSNPCVSFGAPYPVTSWVVTGLDAVTVGNQVVFLLIDGRGEVHAGVTTVQLGVPSSWVDPVPLALDALGEPSLTADGAGGVVAVFKRVSGHLQETRFTTATGWSAPVQVMGDQGALIVRDAPGVVKGRLPGDAQDFVYLHALDENLSTGLTSVALKRRLADGRYTSTSFQGKASRSRPGLAYVPNVVDSSRGTLYTLVTDMVSGRAVMRRSGVTRFGLPVVGFESAYDNFWFNAFGVELMFEPGVDANLRAVVVPNFGGWKSIPLFSPLADGIIDLTYSSFNDWEQVARAACSSVANPGGLVSNPMSCF